MQIKISSKPSHYLYYNVDRKDVSRECLKLVEPTQVLFCWSVHIPCPTTLPPAPSYVLLSTHTYTLTKAEQPFRISCLLDMYCTTDSCLEIVYQPSTSVSSNRTTKHTYVLSMQTLGSTLWNTILFVTYFNKKLVIVTEGPLYNNYNNPQMWAKPSADPRLFSLGKNSPKIKFYRACQLAVSTRYPIHSNVIDNCRPETQMEEINHHLLFVKLYFNIFCFIGLLFGFWLVCPALIHTSFERKTIKRFLFIAKEDESYNTTRVHFPPLAREDLIGKVFPYVPIISSPRSMIGWTQKQRIFGLAVILKLFIQHSAWNHLPFVIV